MCKIWRLFADPDLTDGVKLKSFNFLQRYANVATINISSGTLLLFMKRTNFFRRVNGSILFVPIYCNLYYKTLENYRRRCQF